MGRFAPDDVGVLQLAQHRDLAQRRAGDAVVLGLEPDALERHHRVGLEVHRLVHDAVRALADGPALLDLLVPVHGRHERRTFFEAASSTRKAREEMRWREMLHF